MPPSNDFSEAGSFPTTAENSSIASLLAFQLSVEGEVLDVHPRVPPLLDGVSKGSVPSEVTHVTTVR